jgi:hypothetical protein
MEHANIIIRLKKQPMTVRGSFRLEQWRMWNEGMRWMKGRREGKGGGCEEGREESMSKSCSQIVLSALRNGCS